MADKKSYEEKILSQQELYEREKLKRANKLLSLAERQTDALRQSLEEDQAIRQMMGEYSAEIRDRMSDLQTLPGLAESISKNLGMEKGTKRIMTERLSEMAYYNRDVADALKHGNSGEVQEKMVNLLTDQLETMKFADEHEKAQHKVLIQELKDNAEGFDWDKINANAENIFFPLTQKFWEAAEGMRIAATNIPVVGRLFSEGMVEHYRQGIAEANQILGSHMQTILAPIDALIGPIKGLVKGSWKIAKTLLSGPSKYEKSTAKYTRLTYQATIKDAVERRKNWLAEKRAKAGEIYNKGKEGLMKMLKKLFTDVVVPLVAFGIGFFITFFKELRVQFKAFVNVFQAVARVTDKIFGASGKMTNLMAWFGKIFGQGGKFAKIGEFFIKNFQKLSDFFAKFAKFFTSSAKFAKFFKIGRFVGKLAGKALAPLIMLWKFVQGFDRIKEVFQKEGLLMAIRNTLRNFAGSVLSVVASIPEMLINALLSLFTDFRVDFGKQAIMDWINNATEWVFNTITWPLFSTLGEMYDEVIAFFVGIGAVFTKIKDGLLDAFPKIVDGLINFVMTFFGKIGEVFTKIKDGLTGAVGKIFGGLGSLFGFGGDDDEEEPKKLSDTEQLRKDYAKGIKDGSIDPSLSFGVYQVMHNRNEALYGKSVGSSPDLTAGPKAKTAQTQRGIDAQNATGAKLDTVNNNITDNTQAQQVTQNILNANISGGEKEIPTDNSDLGIMFNNAVFGA